MKRMTFVVFSFLILGVFVLAACGGSQATNAPASNGPAVPAPYAGKTNPHSGDATAIAAGQQIFSANCSACHGDGGLGDGPAGAALNPKPKNLVEAAKATKDDYLLWRVSEGGAMAPFNSAMPSWKSSLSEDQIWDVIAYLHTLK